MGDMMSDSDSAVDQASPKQRPDREGLFMLASEQAGYFTTAQAADYGISPSLLSYHTVSGTMLRAHPGVYRFRDYPWTPREQVVAAWLAVGKESTVISHESALDLWDLTDLIPDAIHLTVPRSRRHLPHLPGVRIHTTMRPLAPDDVWPFESVQATSPQRTLLDVASAGASPEHVIVGIRQARGRGWIDRARLCIEARDRGCRVVEMVDRALSRDEVGMASIS
jgi:predicted transcriptional regulator of viral defense system